MPEQLSHSLGSGSSSWNFNGQGIITGGDASSQTIQNVTG
jgi:hypothetical protein